MIDYDSSMENRKHKFFATNISYTGTLKIELKDKTFKTNCGEAFCVNANGTVVTNFVISDTMKGVAKLQLVANDSAGSTTTSLKVKKTKQGHYRLKHRLKYNYRYLFLFVKYNVFIFRYM